MTLSDTETQLLRQQQLRVEEWMRGTSPLLPIHVYASDPPLPDTVAFELVWWARRIGCLAERHGDVISIRRR